MSQTPHPHGNRHYPGYPHSNDGDTIPAIATPNQELLDDEFAGVPPVGAGAVRASPRGPREPHQPVHPPETPHPPPIELDDPYARQEYMYDRPAGAQTPNFNRRPPLASSPPPIPQYPEEIRAREGRSPQDEMYGTWGDRQATPSEAPLNQSHMQAPQADHWQPPPPANPYDPFGHETQQRFPYDEDQEQSIAMQPYPTYDAPETHLLNPYDRVNFPQAPSPNKPLTTSGYDDSYVADDVENFQPFPIHGDHYQLNTWEDESEDMPVDTTMTGTYPEDDEEDEYEDDEDDDGSFKEQDESPFIDDQPLMPPTEGMQPRRTKTMRKVRLYRGNLVLDCPVSKRMLDQLKEPRQEREFTHMRYSAATCDPAYFLQNNFTLRQTCYQQPRETELFICVTVYNEDDVLLGRTLQGVFANIRHLTSRTRSRTWGKEAWKKVVVCVVADGRAKIHPRALALMASLGVYQEGFAKQQVNDRDVQAHIFEYTTMIGINAKSNQIKLTTEKALPVQMIFCLKERNQKKINSHRWFFQAFGPILQPRVCCLLDAGTMPNHDAIYHLWKTFDMHPNVGGACGEIKAALGTGWTNLLNPLVAAQNFEYKMSNILDKPMESAFGFISVLPGAFSAYRYQAVLNEPLDKYFKGEVMDSKSGIFTANMYLAEDRILCFELVAKRDKNWLLKYVKSSSAETDVPDKLAELVLQRRRWLNGSFFAAIYAQAHLWSIWRSGHSFGRKVMLQVEFLYQLCNMLFSWFGIGNFFLVFRILTGALSDKALGFGPGNVLSVILLWVYCGSIVTIFILSFGNRPAGTQIFYIIVVSFFAFLMAYLIFAAIYISVKSVQYAICIDGGFKVSLVFGNQTFRDLVVSLMSTYALYIISSLMFFEPWHIITSSLQYLLIAPAYINVLNVYAFCNIHDVTWGTKGDTKPEKDLGVAKADDAGKLEVDIPTHVQDIDNAYSEQISKLNVPLKKEKSKPSQEDVTQDYYALFRSSVVLIWMFTNFAIIAVVLNTAGLSALGSNDQNENSSQDRVSLPAAASAAIDGTTRVLLEARASPEQCGSLGSSGGIREQVYLSVVLWAVAALAGVRFVGAVWYLTARLFGR